MKRYLPWATWVALGVLLEHQALACRHDHAPYLDGKPCHPTLSYTTRLTIGEQPPLRYLGDATLIGTLTWFGWHIIRYVGQKDSRGS